MPLAFFCSLVDGVKHFFDSKSEGIFKICWDLYRWSIFEVCFIDSVAVDVPNNLTFEAFQSPHQSLTGHLPERDGVTGHWIEVGCWWDVSLDVSPGVCGGSCVDWIRCR